jgi:beta-lactamase regulating signal transducer with metallopeptidase domain
MLAVAIKAAMLLAASWVGAALLRRSSAAARHLIWTLGVVGAVAMPLAIWLVPALPAKAAITTASFALPAVFVKPAAGTAAFPWLFAIWALGTLVVGTRVVRAHLAARRLVRDATPIDAEIMRSDQIGSPMTVGILRPRILIPTHVEQLHAVLLHERGHIARRDLLVQLVAQIACAMYWWNPLVWIAAARLRIEREHACDDLVIAAGVRPSSYASDILAVAHSMSHEGAVCMVDGKSTEARLRRILDAQAPRTMRTRFRVGAVVLAAAALIACATSPEVAPASRGTMSFGSPSIRTTPLQQPAMFRAVTTQPAIDLALVAAEVQRRSGTLEQCYQRRLATKPSLAGTVEIHWVIAEGGRVVDACITNDTIGDNELTECVNALVKQGPFPAPTEGAVDVSVPFVFAARS